MPHTHLDAAGHPRPQLVRDPDWHDLGGPWQFAHDDADRGRSERWMDPDRWPGPKRLTLDGVHHQGQPVVLSEFGGATLEPPEGAEWFGYDTVATPAAFARRLAALVDAAVGSELAGFCYTQLTDTEQETNGLLTAERQPKLPLPELHGILTRTRARAAPHLPQATTTDADSDLQRGPTSRGGGGRG